LTIEEYIALQLDGSVTAEMVRFKRFEVSESHTWSEYTSEDFSCSIIYEVWNPNPIKEDWDVSAERNYMLGENEVAPFLNSIVPPTPEPHTKRGSRRE
jgi:hypothetical protein